MTNNDLLALNAALKPYGYEATYQLVLTPLPADAVAEDEIIARGKRLTRQMLDVSDAQLQRIVAGTELMARQTEQQTHTLFDQRTVRI